MVAAGLAGVGDGSSPAAVALVVAFCLVTARLFVWPAQGMPARVSAIVMLAGPGDRLPLALQLARDHRAPVLVVSQGQHGYGGPCPSPTPGETLICFDPDPGNTRGEAEFVGRLAKRYHWSSIVVVTAREQDTRARILMARCFRRLDLRDRRIAPVDTLALSDRLRMGSAVQGTGPVPVLLALPLSSREEIIDVLPGVSSASVTVRVSRGVLAGRCSSSPGGSRACRWAGRRPVCWCSAGPWGIR